MPTAIQTNYERAQLLKRIAVLIEELADQIEPIGAGHRPKPATLLVLAGKKGR